MVSHSLSAILGIACVVFVLALSTTPVDASWFHNSHDAASSLSSATLAFVAGSSSPRSSKQSFLSSSSSSTPTEEKPSDTNNLVKGPILRPSIENKDYFDSGCVANPVVLPPCATNNKWQMYYYGNPGSWANETKGFLPTGYVGLAESDDGIHWNKIPGNEAFGSILAPTGLENDFDGLHLGVGDVVRVNGDEELHMYYFGGSFEGVTFPNSPMPPSKGLRMRIGKAKSTDGGRSWERLGQILDYDPQEGIFASWPRIIVSESDDKPWRMLYHAFNGTRWAAFEATSHDQGETWNRTKKMAIGPGVSDGWDGSGVGTRSVARTKHGELVMVYEAVEGQGGPFAGRHRLGLARYDENSGEWIKDTTITGVPGGPILEPGVEPLQPWTSQVIGTPFLVPNPQDGSLRLYYCSKRDSDMCMSIGLVESASGKFDPSSWKAISPE